MAKPEERHKARELRKQGYPITEIARELNVTKDTVTRWCRDITLTPEQEEALQASNPRWNAVQRGAKTNRGKALQQRRDYQLAGREAAKNGSKLHKMGTMLYWAEGSKHKNHLYFPNTDPNMLLLFLRFLREELAVPDDLIKIRIHCHTQDEVEIERIKKYWLNLFNLPDSAMTKVMYKKGTNSRKARYDYGICGLSVSRTEVVQHLFGAIQEYVGFENPDWLA